MRTIKFRGKRVDNGEWVYGGFVRRSRGAIPVILDADESSITFRVVIPDTVGQFTGLHDKNGKEIYEGDVIRSDGYSGARHYIGYQKEEAMFVAFIIGTTPRAYCGVRQHWIDNFNKEVIGNIHDNPELMNP